MNFPQQRLETLWAPWRVQYFELEPQSTKDFLLQAACSCDDKAHFVVKRSKHTFLLLNKYPYTTGHLMVAPYQKKGAMSELSDEEALDLWHLALHAQRLLKAVVHAHGFNLGLNLGPGSGGGVEDHLHLHIVPRWQNDQNFMPLLAGARVIPTGLETLYKAFMDFQEQEDRE